MTKNNQLQKIFVIHQRQQNKKVFTGKNLSRIQCRNFTSNWWRHALKQPNTQANLLPIELHANTFVNV